LAGLVLKEKLGTDGPSIIRALAREDIGDVTRKVLAQVPLRGHEESYNP
jgi:hypothetical protein